MRISKATQTLVLDEAQKLGYRPNMLAGRIKQRSIESPRMSITVFTPFLKGLSNVLGRILYGMQSALMQDDIKVEIVSRPYYNERLCDMKDYLSSMYTDGAIICGISDDDVSFLLKEDFNIPIVLFNRTTEKYSAVYVDDYEAGMKAASVFAAKGHKSTGIIMPDRSLKASSMRQLGFLDGCKKLGLSIDPNHIQKDELNIEGGYRATTRLLTYNEYPPALFVLINEMAVGAVRAIKDKYINIPDDIELLCYGDDQFGEYMTPSLSTIRMPVEAIAAECLRVVMGMLKTNDWRPVSRVQPLTMVYRESCPPA